LPGLLVSRAAISILSTLQTKWLLLVCVVTLLLARGDNVNGSAWPLSHTFEFFHVFVFGFLAKRHELLLKYLNAVTRHPALRMISASLAILCFTCCLVLENSPHRVIFTPLCLIQPDGMNSHSMASNPVYPRLASALPMLYRGVVRAFYVFVWTGWLPNRDYGWLTDLGTRTLTNYLTYNLPIIFVGKFGQCFLLNGLSPTWFCLLGFLSMPFITAFLCSSFFTWSLWPLVMPQIWVGPFIGLPAGMPAGADARDYSLRGYWPSAFLLVSAAINYMLTCGPGNWWGPVVEGGYMELTCHLPPWWKLPEKVGKPQ
jgi:hypothetical protein